MVIDFPLFRVTAYIKYLFRSARKTTQIARLSSQVSNKVLITVAPDVSDCRPYHTFGGDLRTI